jgi:hypothetical protein
MKTTPPDTLDAEHSESTAQFSVAMINFLSKYHLKIVKWYGMVKHYA